MDYYARGLKTALTFFNVAAENKAKPLGLKRKKGGDIYSLVQKERR
jgi:hypothetical protein